MRLSPLVCAATLGIACLSQAQEVPQYELFAGGSYLRVHASGRELMQLTNQSDVLVQAHNWNVNLYGWESAFIQNANHWFAGELDLGGYYGSPSSSFLYPATQLVSPSPNFSQRVPIMTRSETFMYGPRFNWRKRHGVVLFVHAPVGASYVNASLNESAVVASDFSVLAAGRLKSSIGLAVSPGAGLDLRINNRLSFRPAQLDYLMTRHFGARQDSARFSAGLIFKFGEK